MASIISIPNYARYSDSLRAQRPLASEVGQTVEYNQQWQEVQGELKKAGYIPEVTFAVPGKDISKKTTDGPYLKFDSLFPPGPKERFIHLVKANALNPLVPRMVVIGIREITRQRDEALKAMNTASRQLGTALRKAGRGASGNDLLPTLQKAQRRLEKGIEIAGRRHPQN